MNTRSASWSPQTRTGNIHGSRRWDDASPQVKAMIIAAIAIGIGLLVSFYAVVAGAVQRGETSREQQRVALERQFICSAFSSASSRDLCLLTVAQHASHGPVVHALYEPERAPARNLARGRLTAGL